MKSKVIAVIASVPVVVVLAVIFSVSRLSIEHLIICSADSESFIIPYNVCEYYLYNHSGREDAIHLDDGAGLSYVFEIQDREEKYNIINHLISIGVDVNGVSNIDGLTPLNAAILINDSDLVKYLIEKGASLEKKDSSHQLGPKEYVEFLQSNDPDTNRSKIHETILNNMQ